MHFCLIEADKSGSCSTRLMRHELSSINSHRHNKVHTTTVYSSLRWEILGVLRYSRVSMET
jgi:hypothetical protein